jgi:transcriptional regulator with XRE-family HTH domain
MRRTARDHVTTATPAKPGRSYGPRNDVPHPIDVQVGKRIRVRRLLLGMNQAALARALGITFQQVHKYELGVNRVSPSRLSAIADALGVPVSFFFSEGRSPDHDTRMEEPETIKLVRHYYAIPDARVRMQLLQIVKAVAESTERRAPERARKRA